jgi:hypothetical protein
MRIGKVFILHNLSQSKTSGSKKSLLNYRLSPKETDGIETLENGMVDIQRS